MKSIKIRIVNEKRICNWQLCLIIVRIGQTFVKKGRKLQPYWSWTEYHTKRSLKKWKPRRS
jgi:hypothetical protein